MRPFRNRFRRIPLPRLGIMIQRTPPRRIVETQTHSDVHTERSLDASRHEGGQSRIGRSARGGNALLGPGSEASSFAFRGFWCPVREELAFALLSFFLPYSDFCILSSIFYMAM